MKKETVEEFLARGGKITKLPSVSPTNSLSVKANSPQANVTSIISLEEADLYHGEKKKYKTKKSRSSKLKIDISALPEAIRKIYIDEVIDEKKDDIF